LSKAARCYLVLLSTVVALGVAPQAAGAVVLHDQLSGASTGEDRISSQNFEPSLDEYDDLGADDFIIPTGTVWRINRVEIDGGRSGNTREAETANVFLFGDAGTLPGGQLFSQLNVPRGSATYPDLDLSISDVPVFAPGHYWVGVQANLVFNPGANNWFWTDRAPQFGQPAAFRQPGDGFADGCTTFAARSACAYPGTEDVPDQAFRLSGDSASSALDVVTAKVKTPAKVKLTVNAPNIGQLDLTSPQLKAKHVQVSQIGQISFAMKTKRGTRGKLADGDRVKVKVLLDLPDLPGLPLSAKDKFKLKPKQRG
jgi:hypothetical protein